MEFTDATAQGKCHYLQLKVLIWLGSEWNYPQRAILQGGFCWHEQSIQKDYFPPGIEAKHKKFNR